MNKVILQGNLGGDPELKTAAGKTPVCLFNLATNERRKSATGETVEVTEWHRVVTFGRTAESCAKYLKKGDSALIEGKINSSRFTDKEGKTAFSFRVFGNSVRFLTKRSAEREDDVEAFVGEIDETAIV